LLACALAVYEKGLPSNFIAGVLIVLVLIKMKMLCENGVCELVSQQQQQLKSFSLQEIFRCMCSLASAAAVDGPQQTGISLLLLQPGSYTGPHSQTLKPKLITLNLKP
jgi:hypothetical protein